jgi:hypothetical protein
MLAPPAGTAVSGGLAGVIERKTIGFRFQRAKDVLIDMFILKAIATRH